MKFDDLLEQVIDELREQCHSASSTVADHLETVASNGEDSATRKAMRAECLALMDAAKETALRFGPVRCNACDTRYSSKPENCTATRPEPKRVCGHYGFRIAR